MCTSFRRSGRPGAGNTSAPTAEDRGHERVPPPGQIGLFIAAADGSNEHLLVTPTDIDYDAAWAPDGASVVFTSERNGFADLYRVKPDGTGLERLSDSPAYGDQAAFSPDVASCERHCGRSTIRRERRKRT